MDFGQKKCNKFGKKTLLGEEGGNNGCYKIDLNNMKLAICILPV